MPNHRIAVYVWSDSSGNFIALPVDADVFFPGEEYDSVLAPNLNGALKQVQQGFHLHLEALHRRGEEINWPEPIEYEIRSLNVEVRPRYEKDERTFPLDELISFRLPILIGTETPDDDSEDIDSGNEKKRNPATLRCCLPTVLQWFSCFESEDYKKLAAEAFRDSFYKLTPEDILGKVPVTQGQIHYVSIKDKARTKRKVSRRFEHLESVARPLTANLKRGEATAYCRDESVRNLVSLLRGTRRNIALIAPEGTGRSTVLAAAVKQIERLHKDEMRNQSRASRFDEDEFLPVKHRFWLAAAPNLISGAKYLGQWQERLTEVINDLARFNGVLCIDQLAELARLGGESEESVAAFFVPFLESGVLRMVGRITPSELDALQHRCGDFIDKFQLFPMEPLDASRTVTALRQLGESLSREKRRAARETNIEDDVPERLVRLYRRFYPYRPLPGDPSTLLRRLFARALQRKWSQIGSEELLAIFLEETGLPESLIREEKTLSYEEVERFFSSRIIGQADACRRVAQAVTNFKAAMNDPKRPIRSMLFCGPTGVGKTQMAKVLAQFLFENAPGSRSKGFFRVDMSEYMHPWSATRFIEQEDGRPSALIRHVRQRPFSLVLLDEIEKATPEVFDLLLGLLDEGRLTDRIGRTTSFQSTIVIMTSNLGGVSSSIGFDPGKHGETQSGTGSSSHSAHFLKAVREHFRPEFFNRIDDVVSFLPLTRDVSREIVHGELRALRHREGLAERRLRFVPEETLLERLLETGFDPKYGARPLQRQIESFVLPMIAQALLESENPFPETEFFRLEREEESSEGGF